MIVPKTERLVYTGTTQRFPPASVTEELSQYAIPDAAPYGVGVLLFIAVFFILGAAALVVRVGSHEFAALAALLIAGFIWLAFGRKS